MRFLEEARRVSIYVKSSIIIVSICVYSGYLCDLGINQEFIVFVVRI